ncbi:FAD-dependent oxidoreductase [uncultured Desulfuromusa sp.]|uniref:FAD-dependent oxidoreductase n=1 Tax=uncultured Desulfuromusa sp. TaxID=219183 RepID=UPI002AA782E4|nr:FAD-dependent oxidoreductase [uncultured Desulfuromusa sp.]
MKIAVIGAGLAGLTAAKQLHSAGAEVTVFDKSKGTGGRLSSRSFAVGWINHGAPYVSLESDQFSSFLKQNMSIAGVTDLQKTLWDKHACGTKPATGCL